MKELRNRKKTIDTERGNPEDAASGDGNGPPETAENASTRPKKAKAKRKQTATSVGGQTEKSSGGKTGKKHRKHQEVSC